MTKGLGVFTLLLAMALPASAETMPGEGFEVERYNVALRPDLRTAALSGIETITVRATDDRVARLAFSPNALRIDDATINGAPVAIVRDGNAIAFTLSSPLKQGDRATLRFRFGGTPARGVTAVPGGIYTSYFACDWMVCLQDAPGDKAHLLLDLFLPAGVVSVGVGRPEPAKAISAGLVRHRWRSERPYSPYLFAFAAGAFPRRMETTRLRTLAYVDATGTDADLTKAFARSSEMAAFFAEKAGVGLPHRRYTQILVPGREAQESAGFSLIGQAELEREQGDTTTAWVIAHEMAHHWWGNLVTCATWQDFWLNEGIATFMVAAWKEHAFGAASYRAELDVARQRLDRARTAGFDKPLAWSGKYPSLGMRRAVQYSKGALFMARLREDMGDAAFWTGLRHYTRRHAGGTVTSADFERAMQSATERDLVPLFTEWVYGTSPRPATSG